MALGLYKKTPTERKRYSIDYYDWLDEGERIFIMAFQVAPVGELEIDAFSIDANGTEVVFFANGGVDGGEYEVNVRMTTSGGQVKEDEVLFEVDEIMDVIVAPI